MDNHGVATGLDANTLSPKTPISNSAIDGYMTDAAQSSNQPDRKPDATAAAESLSRGEDVCEICWLPVEGKRPEKPLRYYKNLQKARAKKEQQDKKQSQQGNEVPGSAVAVKKWMDKVLRRWQSHKQHPHTSATEVEEPEYWIQLPCSHRFGSECLLQWKHIEDEALRLGENTTGGYLCPTCKRPYLRHTCRQKASPWKVVRLYQTMKHVAIGRPQRPCASCDVAAIELGRRKQLGIQYWETGLAACVVGIAFYLIVPHNQRYGYEPPTTVRRFMLRRFPKSWLGAVERTWRFKVNVGDGNSRRAVSIDCLGRRRPARPSKKDRKQNRRQARNRRKKTRLQRHLFRGSARSTLMTVEPPADAKSRPSSADYGSFGPCN